MLSFHGATYLDLSPLLYPGTSRVCGAYSLHPYTEAEVLNKVLSFVLDQYSGAVHYLN